MLFCLLMLPLRSIYDGGTCNGKRRQNFPPGEKEEEVHKLCLCKCRAEKVATTLFPLFTGIPCLGGGAPLAYYKSHFPLLLRPAVHEIEFSHPPPTPIFQNGKRQQQSPN